MKKLHVYLSRFAMRLAFSLGVATFCGFARATTPPIDTIVFGSAESERAHGLTADHSEVIAGAMGESARRLLPLESRNWEGGRFTFTMKVDPVKPNYFTIRLWGSDGVKNDLVLFVEGKQVGYRNAGDVDLLDMGEEQPSYNGRFAYKTTPLPLAVTKGNTQLQCEIRGNGPTWSYARTFEQFQKTMTEPTCGIYRVYTHTDGCFIPPADEKQGEAPADPPVRQDPGLEVLDQLKERVNKELNNLLASSKPLNQMQMLFLARVFCEVDARS